MSYECGITVILIKILLTVHPQIMCNSVNTLPSTNHMDDMYIVRNASTSPQKTKNSIKTCFLFHRSLMEIHADFQRITSYMQAEYAFFNIFELHKLQKLLI